MQKVHHVSEPFGFQSRVSMTELIHELQGVVASNHTHEDLGKRDPVTKFSYILVELSKLEEACVTIALQAPFKSLDLLT